MNDYMSWYVDIMDGFDPKKLELIKDIFNTINIGKML